VQSSARWGGKGALEVGSDYPALQSIGLPAFDQSVVFRVRPDPKPHNFDFLLNGQSPVVQTNPNGPEAANSFEMQ